MNNGYYIANYWVSNYWPENYWPAWGQSTVSVTIPIYESIGMIRYLFNNEIIVYNVTESVSTTTGENLKANSTGTTIKCRINPVSQSDMYRANKLNSVVKQLLYCDFSTTFDEGDRFSYQGNIYEITGLKNPSEWCRYMSVEYQRVK